MAELAKLASKDTVETAVVLAQVVTGLSNLTIEVGRLTSEIGKTTAITQQLCVWQGAVNERHRIEDGKSKGPSAARAATPEWERIARTILVAVVLGFALAFGYVELILPKIMK